MKLISCNNPSNTNNQHLKVKEFSSNQSDFKVFLVEYEKALYEKNETAKKELFQKALSNPVYFINHFAKFKYSHETAKWHPLPKNKFKSSNIETVYPTESNGALYFICAIYYENIDFTKSIKLISSDSLLKPKLVFYYDNYIEDYLNPAWQEISVWIDSLNKSSIDNFRNTNFEPLKHIKFGGPLLPHEEN